MLRRQFPVYNALYSMLECVFFIRQYQALLECIMHAFLKYNVHRVLSLQRTQLSHSRLFSTQSTGIAPNALLDDQADQAAGKVVHAKFTHVAKEDKLQFPNANCLVTLSIGQPYHEGQHLAATLNLVNQTFSSCTFILGDTLQRHTMRISQPMMDEEACLQQSQTKGAMWLKNNMTLLSKLDIPWTIKRWNHWLRHARFPELLKTIEQTRLSESSYQYAFEENIQTYLERLESRNELKLDRSLAHQQCLKYLQEECAAMCLWLEDPSPFELYASGRTLAMQQTYDRFIKPLHPDLLKPLALRFKTKPLSKTFSQNGLLIPEHRDIVVADDFESSPCKRFPDNREGNGLMKESENGLVPRTTY